jgi:hypothetical protein
MPLWHTRLPSAVCRLPSAVCRLPSADCRLPSAVCRLPSAVCRLPSAGKLCCHSLVCQTILQFCPHGIRMIPAHAQRNMTRSKVTAHQEEEMPTSRKQDQKAPQRGCFYSTRASHVCQTISVTTISVFHFARFKSGRCHVKSRQIFAQLPAENPLSNHLFSA